MQIALAQAAGIALPASAQPQPSVVFDVYPFSLGVASGHPTDQSVVLWTRLLPLNPLRNLWSEQTLAIEWELSLDASFKQIVRNGGTVAPPELAHSVHVEVEGLKPNQSYFYRFKAYGEVSPTGQTRTFPASNDKISKMRFGFASCQRFHEGYFTAYDHMLADQVDFVVFLGDYIYEVGASQDEVRGTRADGAARLDEYRDLYELAREDPSLRQMHAACPWLVTWDDHEVTDDYAGGEVRAGLDTGRTASKMQIGYQAWYEHMPVSPKVLTKGILGLTEQSAEVKIYNDYRFGSLATLNLLDTRQYRSPQVLCGPLGFFTPGSCDAVNDTNRTMLGAEQEAWLDTQLKQAGKQSKTSTVWNFLCQASSFSPFLIPALGERLNHDSWDGYAYSRRQIIDSCIHYGVRNPVMLGGDIHQNYVTHVNQDKSDPPVIVMSEFIGTSISSKSFSDITAEAFKASNPHCIYADRHRRGYGLVHITKKQMRVDLRVIDDVTKPKTSVSTIASFEVMAGSPLIKRIDTKS